jgi:WD40 repeat protein
VLIGTCQGDVDIFSLDTGALLDSLGGHTGCVNDMVFSPDGKFLAVSQAGPTVVWDWQARKVVLRVGPRAGPLAFSPDGARLAAMIIEQAPLFSGVYTSVFLVNPADIIALARSRLTRGWTLDECRRYLHRETCP